MRKVGNVISTVLIVILAVLLCTVLVLKLCFGVEMKAVLTGSMEPELSVGSLLIITPTEYEDINIGNDITFVRDKNMTLVTHRVIAKDDENKQITTQGIANNTPDAPTSYDNVVGKVSFSIPYLGYIIIWTSDLKGKIIVCIIIAALVAISLFFGKEPKKKETSDCDENSNSVT
ncbi:MAG: signal peptidase I [Acutalibacteraceae bacterium]